MRENDLLWLLWVLGAIQAILTVVIGAGVKGLFVLSSRIGAQNGRIGKVEQWKEDHEKESGRREERNTATHKELWDAVNEVRFGKGRAPAGN